MRVEHAFTMIARCPMNNLQDVYDVTFRMDKVLPVERILGHIGGLVGVKLFQEEITQSLADTFECEVETVGVHSNVKTRVICTPQLVPPKKCQRCEGDGKAHGADRPFEWTPEKGYPGPCPVCNGSGIETEQKS